MKRKCVAVGIILLFIGVAIAPSINSTVVKASDDNDLVKVTSQACGIQGFGNTTVKLTKQQYQDLEQYLVDFRARLNQTTTRDEAVPIFKDAVVELNKYGLLPKGMSIQRIQDIVTGNNIPKRIHHILEKNAQRGTFFNILDLVYASGDLAGGNVGNFNLMALGIIFGGFTIIPYGLVMLLFLYSQIKPLNLFSFVVLLYPAKVYSIGLLGIKQDDTNAEISIVGFTGLQIITHLGNPVESVYLGWSIGITKRF